MAETRSPIGCDDRALKANSKSLPALNSADAFQPQPDTFEVVKNSHEKFRCTFQNGIVRLSLWRANGRGAYLPTPNSLAFGRRHLSAIRKLLDKLEGAK